MLPNISCLVKRTDYNTKIIDIKSKIPNVTGLVTNTMLNTKTTEIVKKLPDTAKSVYKGFSEYKSHGS